MPPLLGQIFPGRIYSLDEPNFLLAPPALNLFLSMDRIVDVLVVFIPDKARTAIVSSEAIEKAVFVLPNTSSRLPVTPVYRVRDLLDIM